MSVMSIEHLEGTTWTAKFGEFAAEEAPILADSIDTLTGQAKIGQLMLLDWNDNVRAVVDHLYAKGFVFMENKDGHGEVVNRAVWKRDVESGSKVI